MPDKKRKPRRVRVARNIRNTVNDYVVRSFSFPALWVRDCNGGKVTRER